jgi:tubulin delta
MRREAEKSDFVMGSVIMHSLAGGTGSGLGSRVIEEYKDYFPKQFLMTLSVWPSIYGETPLQNYNAIFSLAKL